MTIAESSVILNEVKNLLFNRGFKVDIVSDSSSPDRCREPQNDNPIHTVILNPAEPDECYGHPPKESFGPSGESSFNR